MSDGFDEHASVEFKAKHPFEAKSCLLNGFYRQKYESVNNQNHSTNLEENRNLNFKFDKARERIKQEIISSGKSSDKGIVYTAMTNFKKRRI